MPRNGSYEAEEGSSYFIQSEKFRGVPGAEVGFDNASLSRMICTNAILDLKLPFCNSTNRRACLEGDADDLALTLTYGHGMPPTGASEW